MGWHVSKAPCGGSPLCSSTSEDSTLSPRNFVFLTLSAGVEFPEKPTVVDAWSIRASIVGHAAQRSLYSKISSLIFIETSVPVAPQREWLSKATFPSTPCFTSSPSFSSLLLFHRHKALAGAVWCFSPVRSSVLILTAKGILSVETFKHVTAKLQETGFFFLLIFYRETQSAPKEGKLMLVEWKQTEVL